MQIRGFLYIVLLAISFACPEVFAETSDKRLWVVFKKDALETESKRSDLLERLTVSGFSIHRESRWLNSISGYASDSVIATISRWSEVLRIEPVIRFTRQLPEKKPIYKRASFTGGDDKHPVYGSNHSTYELCRITKAHKLVDSLTNDRKEYGKGVRIAVLDAGFTLRHEVFSHLADSQIIATRDYVQSDTNVENDSLDSPDQEEHGTSVLSLIAGKKEGELFGIAPSASFILAKVEITKTYKVRLDSRDRPIVDSTGDTLKYWAETEIEAEEDNWIAAAEWVVDSLKADIITSSIGFRDDFTDGRDPYPDSVMDGSSLRISVAADSAFARGALVVKAVGNRHHYRSTTLTAPADGHNVIAVGAVDANGILADYSSSGPTFDGRVKPDVLAPGHQITCAYGRLNHYMSMNGTSFAAPMTAAILALTIQYNKLTGTVISNDSLLKRIRKSTDSPSWMDSTSLGWGYGVINAYTLMTNRADSSYFAQYKEDEIRFQVSPIPVSREKSINLTAFTDNRAYVDERTDTLSVLLFTLSGKQIVKLVKKESSAGATTTIKWNMTTQGGRKISPGVYLYKAYFKGKNFLGKMAVVR